MGPQAESQILDFSKEEEEEEEEAGEAEIVQLIHILDDDFNYVSDEEGKRQANLEEDDFVPSMVESAVTRDRSRMDFGDKDNAKYVNIKSDAKSPLQIRFPFAGKAASALRIIPEEEIKKEDDDFVPSMTDSSVTRLQSRVDVENLNEIINSDSILHLEKLYPCDNTKMKAKAKIDDSEKVSNDMDLKHLVPKIIPMASPNLQTMGMGKKKRYTVENMCSALDGVFSGRLPVRGACKMYGIPHSTLADRLAMTIKERLSQLPGCYPINAENEGKIIKYVKNSPGIDRWTLLQDVMYMAIDLAKSQMQPFKDPLMVRKWLRSFDLKHPELHLIAYPNSTNRRTNSISTPQLANVGYLTDALSPRLRQASTPPDAPSTPEHTPITVSISPNFSYLDSSLNDSKSSGFSRVELEFLTPEQRSSSRSSSTAESLHDDSFENMTSRIMERHRSKRQKDALEKCFEFWKLVKMNIDSTKSEKDLADVLFDETIFGIEQILDPADLNYFKYRHELEEQGMSEEVLPTHTRRSDLKSSNSDVVNSVFR